MEKFSEDAELIGKLRNFLQQEATLSARVMTGKVTDTSQEVQKFRDYFELDEPLKTTPSHRVHSMFLGRNEGLLSLSTIVDNDEYLSVHRCDVMIVVHWQIKNE